MTGNNEHRHGLFSKYHDKQITLWKFWINQTLKMFLRKYSNNNLSSSESSISSSEVADVIVTSGLSCADWSKGGITTFM